MAVGAGAGLLAEGAWQIYSDEQEFDLGRLAGAGLIGALGGWATKIPGLGKYAAQAALGAGATTLEGDIDVGAMVLGGALGVTAEYAGQALTSEIVDKGLYQVRKGLLSHFRTMIEHGRDARDALAAAYLFDALVSDTSRGAAVGTLAGLVMEMIQEGEGGGE